MTKRIKWHKGPPPSVGWWPASVARNSNRLRWWDGRQWSDWACIGISADNAEKLARRPAAIYEGEEIKWTDRPASWPERSRT